jgi:uroporphyrinogen decarboxylase
MTGLERCLAVLQGKKPDRIPVVPSITNYAVEYGGYQMKDVLYNADKLADCLIRTCDDFELDGLEVVLDTAVSPEALGVKVCFRDDEAAVCIGGAITDYDQVKDLPMIDPYRDGRIPVYLKTVNILRKKLGDHALILNSIGQAPFSMAIMLRGMEDGLADLALLEDLEPVVRLIDHCEQCLERIAKAYREEGTHLVYCGDSMASSDAVSPAMYEQLAFPSEKRLAEYISTLDVYFYYRSDS